MPSEVPSDPHGRGRRAALEPCRRIKLRKGMSVGEARSFRDSGVPDYQN